VSGAAGRRAGTNKRVVANGYEHSGPCVLAEFLGQLVRALWALTARSARRRPGGSSPGSSPTGRAERDGTRVPVRLPVAEVGSPVPSITSTAAPTGPRPWAQRVADDPQPPPSRGLRAQSVL